MIARARDEGPALKVIPGGQPDMGVAGALRRAGIKAKPKGAGLLLRFDGGDGRVVYLEERRLDGLRRAAWIVHADGALGEPARQHVCRTLAEAMPLLASELGELADAAPAR